MFAERQSRNWSTSSKHTRTASLWWQTWTRPNNSIRSAKSRRNWSAAWWTQSTSSCARSLPRYNAQIVHYTETLALYCACGKRLQPSDRDRQLNKERYDVLSITNYVKKKNPSHGAWHGPTMRQKIYHKSTICLKRTGESSAAQSWKGSKQIFFIGNHWPTLAGWERHNGDHSYNATRGERSRNERSWRLVLNAEGAQGPLDQRDDNKQAKETCNKMYKEHAATAGCGNAPIHPQQQVRQKSNQQFDGHEEDSYRLDSSAKMHSSLPLRHLGGKSQTAVSVELGNFIMEWTVICFPSLQIIQSPGNRRGCNKYTYRAHVFLMRSSSVFLSQSLVTVCSPG